MLPNYGFSPSSLSYPTIVSHSPHSPHYQHIHPNIFTNSNPYPHSNILPYSSSSLVNKYSTNDANANLMVSNRKLEHINCILPKSEQEGGLYIGGTIATLRQDIIANNRINTVLCCNAEASNNYTLYPSQTLIFKYIPLQDHIQFPISDYFEQSYDYIQYNRQQGFNVLIQCHGGASRSGTILIAYLMKKWKMGLREVYEFVKQRRNRIKPNQGFWEQLMQYEKILSKQWNSQNGKEIDHLKNNQNQWIHGQELENQQNINIIESNIENTPKINRNFKNNSKSVTVPIEDLQQNSQNLRISENPQKQQPRQKSEHQQHNSGSLYQPSPRSYYITQQFSNFANSPSSPPKNAPHFSTNSGQSPRKLNSIKPKSSLNNNNNNLMRSSTSNSAPYQSINPIYHQQQLYPSSPSNYPTTTYYHIIQPIRPSAQGQHQQYWRIY